MGMKCSVVDISHLNGPIQFHALKDAGIVGVIIKMSQGSSYVDPNFEDNYTRACKVFGQASTHVYHFLDNSDPHAQAEHILAVRSGFDPFIWLDYETNPSGQTCSLDTAVAVFHEVHAETGGCGIYGSDKLAEAIVAGHFVGVPMWGARYGAEPPTWLKSGLWQYSESGSIGGLTGVDLSTFVNVDAEWFASL